MASPFKTVEVAIRYDNARVVTWELQSGYNYPADFTLQVENCRAGDKWEVLSGNLKDCCCFVDSRRRNFGKRMNEHYRLRLIVDDSEQYVSDTIAAGRVSVYPYSTEASNAITQIEEAIEQSGVTGVLLKRKEYGPRCPLCTDFNGQSTVNEHCPRCMGTGIDGGFYGGISMSLVKDSISVAEGVTQSGAAQSETVKARCIAYPWIHAGDIWSEDNTNARYVIVACTPTSVYKTTPLVYTLQMNRVEYTDSAYSAEQDRKVAAPDKWNEAENTAAPTQPKPSSAFSWDEALDKF